MVVLKFRNSGEHADLLKKVKKMKEFTEDLEECLEDAMDEDYGYRGGSYRKEWEDDEEMMKRSDGRYSYRGMKR